MHERLLELPCVVARDGRRLVPPLEDAPEAVALDVSPLAQQLGVVTPLHPAHLANEPGARRVLDWLRACGAVVDGTDDREVVNRLAVAGRSGRCVARPLRANSYKPCARSLNSWSHRSANALELTSDVQSNLKPTNTRSRAGGNAARRHCSGGRCLSAARG